MKDQELAYGDDYKFIPMTSVKSGSGIEVRPDVYTLTLQIVNILLLGKPGSQDFILVDAGLNGTADEIVEAVEGRFGKNARPKAIVLTHGHFDHVGAVIELVRRWDTPVYAHDLELPYLTGEADYPPPDPSADSGLLAKISPWYPRKAIRLGSSVQSLPADGSVPGMPDFRWIHTPGHTPGHISLYRSADGMLIAGDAFVTVKQESVYKVFLQELEISGPPKYFTTDWVLAKESVRKLADLKPSAAVTGHGRPMEGQLLAESLERLVRDFEDIAVPRQGRYV